MSAIVVIVGLILACAAVWMVAAAAVEERYERAGTCPCRPCRSARGEAL